MEIVTYRKKPMQKGKDGVRRPFFFEAAGWCDRSARSLFAIALRDSFVKLQCIINMSDYCVKYCELLLFAIALRDYLVYFTLPVNPHFFLFALFLRAAFHFLEPGALITLFLPLDWNAFLPILGGFVLLKV